MDLTQLLAFTMQNKASDLHLSAGSPPVIRVNSDLKRVKADPLTGDDIRTMLYSVMSEAQRAEFEEKMDYDFAIALGEKARFRVNAFVTRIGTSAVFRVIPTEIPTLEELGLPPIMKKFAELKQGLILVTGATGSGKSTTLAAMINHMNQTRSEHILTIEDPVEFFHTSQKALVNHREVHADTLGFSNALRASLREDPDIILVGEMRDYETISLALTAAETGHLVLGTLHANSAAKTVDRIIDVFPTGDKGMVRAMLASSLQAVIAQTLLKRADGTGRIAAHEILVGTSAVRNLIRENQIAQVTSMIQTGLRYGMITMQDSVKTLLEDEIISPQEARRILLEVNDEDSASDEDETASSSSSTRMGGNVSPAHDTMHDDKGYSF